MLECETTSSTGQGDQLSRPRTAMNPDETMPMLEDQLVLCESNAILPIFHRRSRSTASSILVPTVARLAQNLTDPEAVKGNRRQKL